MVNENKNPHEEDFWEPEAGAVDWGSTNPEIIWAKRDEAWEIITGLPMNILTAAYTGNAPRLKKHLEAGVSKDELANALHYACEGGNKETVKQCVEAGADVNAKDCFGRTAQDMTDDEEITDLLREHGHKTDEPPTSKKSTIHDAVKIDDIDAVKIFLSEGSVVNATEAMFETTPLHIAAAYKRKEIIELLIANGANVKAKDRDEWTPLHFATNAGHRGIAELLIANGANVNAMDTGGETPLDKARTKGNYEAISLLIKHDGKTGAELKA